MGNFTTNLEKDGVLGLYTGYSATLLRNLRAGVLSYSSFEWLKTVVLKKKKKKEKLTPLESVCCGVLAGALSASLTTPLDVVKTRLMTQFHGLGVNNKVGDVRASLTTNLKKKVWVASQ